MSLRTRLIVLVVLISVLPIALFGFTAYRISTNNLLDVERDNLKQALAGVDRALDDLQNNQTKPMTDWSNYDDLHAQVAQGTPDPDWLKSNFDPTVDKSAGNTYNLGLIGLWAADLKSLYTFGPADDAAHTLDAAMKAAPTKDTPATQIALLGEDVYIVSIASVRTSTGTDPNGILMFGLKIEQSQMDQIKALTGYDVALYRDTKPITAVQGPMPGPAALSEAAAGNEFYEQTDPNTALALKPLKDFTGRNVATIVVSRSRTAIIAAQNSITDTLIVFFVVALLVAGGVALILTRSIIPPLLAVIEAANRFAEGDLDQRVDIMGQDDELSVLGKAFNSMANRITARVQSSEGERARLEEIDTYRLNLLTEIARALRGPLNAIDNNAKTLAQLQYGSLNEPQTRLVNGILRAGTQEATLLTDLLDYSRAQRNQLQLIRERLSIGELVRESAASVQQRYKDKAIQFVEAIPDGLPMVMADRVRLEQIMDNLLTWVFDYSVAGGQVKVIARAQDRFVEVRISDSSRGLSTEQRAKVFDLFYHPNGQADASAGLGLAFVKALVEQQGGAIRVDTEVGLGNIFTVTIPT
ncbi:MAG TPA: ATP-binding protein [Aggregatilineales bacterium]|nr:ATP-binding protein [Aggregatilineales bacterium]